MFCRFVYMEEVVYISVFVSVFCCFCLKYMFFSIFKQAYSYAISLLNVDAGIVDENFFQDFSVRVGDMVY